MIKIQETLSTFSDRDLERYNLQDSFERHRFTCDVTLNLDYLVP